MKAELNYIRIAPRKMRLVADLVRRKKVRDAETLLKFSTKKGAKPLLKLINSAVANAKNNLGRDTENLYVSHLTVNQGPVFKRSMPKARGMSSLIRKKTSHVSLALGELPANNLTLNAKR